MRLVRISEALEPLGDDVGALQTRAYVVADRAAIAAQQLSNTRALSLRGAPWVAGSSGGPDAVQDLDGTWFERALNYMEHFSLPDFYRAGDSDYSAALGRIAALSPNALHVIVPPGVWPMSALTTFTDKNVVITGAGSGISVMTFTDPAGKIKFYDPNNSIAPTTLKRFKASGITLLKDHAATGITGGTALEAQWSYTGGSVSSLKRGDFSDIVVQGQSGKIWAAGLRLKDAGCIMMGKLAFDNGGSGNTTSDSLAAIIIERDAATNCTAFFLDKSQLHVWQQGIRFENRNASEGAGSIEGIYCTGNEIFTTQYGIYSDDQASPDSGYAISALHYTGGHMNCSRYAILGGRFDRMYIVGNDLDFTSFGDPAPALIAAFRSTGYAFDWHITGNRFNRTSLAATGKPVLYLPTEASVLRVKAHGNTFDDWGYVVNQAGTPTTDPARIFIGNDNYLSNGTDTSSTGSGYFEPFVLHGGSTYADEDTVTFTTPFKSQPRVFVNHKSTTDVVVKAYNVTETGFQVHVEGGGSAGIDWMAAGVPDYNA